MRDVRGYTRIKHYSTMDEEKDRSTNTHHNEDAYKIDMVWLEKPA